MKVNVENYSGIKSVCVDEYVYTSTLSKSHDDGVIESIEYQSDKTGKALGRLCDVLLKRGVLEDSDIGEIVGSFDRVTKGE